MDCLIYHKYLILNGNNKVDYDANDIDFLMHIVLYLHVKCFKWLFHH